MFEKSLIIKLFENIGSNLSSNITIYLIGGGNMSLKGLKPATKDIDLVLLSKKDLDILKPIIEKQGYKIDKELFEEAVYRDAFLVFQDESESRIDVFINIVCNQLKLSENIRKRSKEYARYEKLKIMLVSNEDLFLFKSITDRPQDIDDCLTLINAGLKWNIILSECISQHRKETKWIFWVYEQICRIEESKDVSLPQKSSIFQICVKNWNNKPQDFMAEFTKEQIIKHIPRQYQKKIFKSIDKVERKK